MVGGALLTTGCSSEEDPERADANAAQSANRDGGDSTVDGAAATPDATPGELETCGFCPNECCVYDENGDGAAMEGFECCWGTAC